MLNQASRRTPSKAKKPIKRKLKPEIDEQHEEICRAATLYLITNVGGLFVATGVSQTSIKGFKIWIITVTMRYPTRHEGYVGDLLYDGDVFTMLTEDKVIGERVDKIAADPERKRKWFAISAEPTKGSGAVASFVRSRKKTGRTPKVPIKHTPRGRHR